MNETKPHTTGEINLKRMFLFLAKTEPNKPPVKTYNALGKNSSLLSCNELTVEKISLSVSKYCSDLSIYTFLESSKYL